MRLIFIFTCVFFFLMSCTSTNNRTPIKAELSNQQEVVSKQNTAKYSSGGFASIVIDRPVDIVFDMLTDVNSWTKINLGVTLSILPDSIVAQKDIKFKEIIASPIPGIENWTNEWLVEEFVLGEKFVISGRENFTRSPIYSRIIYSFTALPDNKTLFKRTIEVTIDDVFTQESSTI